MASTAVVFDLDDTLADFAGFDGTYFDGAMTCGFAPIDNMVRVFNDFVAAGIEPLIVTARPMLMRAATEEWVMRVLGDFPVYMTDSPIRRKDWDVKRDIVTALMQEYNIIKAFDDKPMNIAMFESLGIEGVLV